MSCAGKREISFTAFSLRSTFDGFRRTMCSVPVLAASPRPSPHKESTEQSFVDDLECCEEDSLLGRELLPFGIGGRRQDADDGLECDNALDIFPTNGDEGRDLDDARDPAGEVCNELCAELRAELCAEVFKDDDPDAMEVGCDDK